jgi:organic hydroperoxide reductase OsmC/OhrA
VARTHCYTITTEWTGNLGTGTADYRSYGRQHEIFAGEGKPAIPGSSDRAFRGDATRWNPEELLVASLSACHKLTYLHLCADAGLVVVAYTDHAQGIMAEAPNGSGRFQSVVLHPQVTVVAGSDIAQARDLHHSAHAKCFIANSVNFPVTVEPEITLA